MYCHLSLYLWLLFSTEGKWTVSFRNELKFFNTSNNREAKTGGGDGDQLHQTFRGAFIRMAPERQSRRSHLCVRRTQTHTGGFNLRVFVIVPAGGNTGHSNSLIEAQMETVSPSSHGTADILLLIKQSSNTSRQSLVWTSPVWSKVCSPRSTTALRWTRSKCGVRFHTPTNRHMQSSVNSSSESHRRGETRWGWNHQAGVGLRPWKNFQEEERWGSKTNFNEQVLQLLSLRVSKSDFQRPRFEMKMDVATITSPIN